MFVFILLVFITDQLCRIMANVVIDCGNLHFDRILQRKSSIYVLSKADMHSLYRIAQPRTGNIFVSPREVRSRSPLSGAFDRQTSPRAPRWVLRGKGGLRFFYCVIACYLPIPSFFPRSFLFLHQSYILNQPHPPSPTPF